MVIPRHRDSNGCGHLQQYPHQGCTAHPGATSRAHAPAAKGIARDKTADEERIAMNERYSKRYNEIRLLIDEQGPEIIKDFSLISLLANKNVFEDFPDSPKLLEDLIKTGTMDGIYKTYSKNQDDWGLYISWYEERTIKSNTYDRSLVRLVFCCLVYGL